MMKKPLKIAVYSGEIPSTTFIERLIEGLSKDKNFKILLFGLKHTYKKYNNNVSVLGYRINKISKGFHLLKYGFLLYMFKYSEKKKLDKILTDTKKKTLNNLVKSYPVLWYKPDVFHVQWAKSIQDWDWVQEFGMKLVLSLRGAHINYSPIADNQLANTYKKTFPKVDAFHAVSKAIKIEAQKYGAPDGKVKVIYSGLDMKAINTFRNKKENSIIKLISVGRSHWKKGYTYAIDACYFMKERNISFNYKIIGGANNLELMYQINDLGLENQVELLDNMPFERVQQLISHADLLLLPSVEEGIANVVIEAMVQNTLVLSTDCGGMNEVIEHGKNGFLVPIRDSKLIADSIIMISKLTPDDYRKITKSAQEKIYQQHNTESMIKGMTSLYNDII